jgi:hypothetical protein
MNVTVLLNNTPITTTSPADRARGSQVSAGLIAPVDR